jgi:hypothetical protein
VLNFKRDLLPSWSFDKRSYQHLIEKFDKKYYVAKKQNRAVLNSMKGNHLIGKMNVSKPFQNLQSGSRSRWIEGGNYSNSGLFLRYAQTPLFQIGPPVSRIGPLYPT